MDAQDSRIAAIVGDEDKWDIPDGMNKFYSHLSTSLELPCEVCGIEDFRWEERYIFGPGKQKEYEKLKQSQPSYSDKYTLLEIVPSGYSEWMMCPDEDIAAQVRRLSDGKEFLLGLSELEACNKKSMNYQLLHDYAVWFVNK